jgi:DNA-binding ferritin-like protein
MPTIDFTLDDIARQTERIIENALIKEREHTKTMVQTMIQTAAEGTLQQTRQMLHQTIAQASAEIIQTITGEFASFWDDNLGPAFEDLHNEFKELREEVKTHGRILDRHSKDIMELRARQA